MSTAEHSVEIGAEPQPQREAPTTSWLRWAGGGGLLLLIALILVAFGMRISGRGSSGNGFGVNRLGQLGQFKPRPAPAMRLQLYDGSTLSLSDLRGQMVVLNFWGSWCVPCREEAPALERVWQASREQGVQLVGINIWDAESDGRRFIEEQRITYPNALDPGGKFAIELGVTGLPETYFITPEGQVVQHWIGPASEEKLLALIAQMAPVGKQPALREGEMK